MKIFTTALSAAALTVALGWSAQAQDWSAAPAYGSISLDAGFAEDPTSIPVRAGGAIYAGNASDYCSGYITHQPSYNLNYDAGGFDLFLSAASDVDAVLVVNAPDGSWHCNDDAPGQGLNPGVSFENPQSGQYNIWVGSLGSGSGFEPAMLHISEIGFFSDNAYSRAPNPNLQPHAGTLNLNAGFNDDPRILPVRAGGDLDGSRGTSGQCYGHVSEAPDAWVNYAASDSFDLFVSMQSEADTTLIIQDPNGDWHCDDDEAGDLNPGVHISDPVTGRYAIWAGRFSPGAASDANLYISELGFLGGVIEPAVLDYSLPSNFGSVELEAGFAPDPHNVEVMAGGDVPVYEAVGDNCRGYASTAPDYDLTYEAGSLDLYISATSEGDTTLVVNAPDGSWWCDDDSAGSLNPGIRFDAPESGRYDIWVGTYGEAGLEPAMLHISELAFGNVYLSDMALDFSLDANYGGVELDGGFLPDPYTVDLVAGGPIPAADGADARCRGHVTAAPDFELTYQSGDLDLYISAISDGDTTLVINDPSGNWVCNDDNNGLDPGVHFENPQAGVYDIWVGTYSEGNGAEAQLRISELGFEE